MSIGKKKSFEPRVEAEGQSNRPLRSRSEKQCKESKKTLGFPKRSHTISTANLRRWSIMSHKAGSEGDGNEVEDEVQHS